MTETAEPGSPIVSVATTSTATSLVVRYDGSRPPTALFTAWTGLGWQAPVPAGPPRHAIDWSTPDPIRGTSHTIRPHPAIGSATLDDDRRRDVDGLVEAALEVAVQLGCRVDRPAIDEIDLRDRADQPADDVVVDLTSAGRAGPVGRTPRLRRQRGAQARVRATIPTAALEEVARVVGDLGATLDHDTDPSSGDDEPHSRVTVAVAASSGDAVMRCLAAISTGTPTIEIVTARDLAGRRT